MGKNKSISYKTGYKYQLASEYKINIGTKFSKDIIFDWVSLLKDGTLIISKGYAWDGASGAFDTKSILRASLVHDALYQLIRLKLIPESTRDLADKLLQKLCIEDGMNSIRAWYVYQAVHIFGKKFTTERERPVEIAP